MSQLAKFDGYTMREIEERDHAQLAAWIAEDPAHRDVFKPEFFTGEDDSRAGCYVLEDKHRTLMYIRLSRATRVHIQFRPEDPATPRKPQRKRLALALLKGMAFLEIHLRRAGAAEWIFDTESDPLRQLAISRLGFRLSSNELVREIEKEAGDVRRTN